MTKREREIRKIVKGLGIDAEVGHRKGGQHFMITLSNGRKYFTSASPSDGRSNKNLTSDLRKIAQQPM